MSKAKGKDEGREPATGGSFQEEPRSFTDTHGVITSTMNDIPGYRVVKVLGTVYGLTVRSRNWGADLGSLPSACSAVVPAWSC